MKILMRMEIPLKLNYNLFLFVIYKKGKEDFIPV